MAWRCERFRRFRDQFLGDIEPFWRLKPSDIEEGKAFDFLTATQRKGLAAIVELGRERFEARVEEWPGEVMLVSDEGFPTRLRQLGKAPSAIHILGQRRCLEQAGIAVVGSREIGVEAASTARRILGPLVNEGVAVISGGALGADGVAHRCAMELTGRTAVVLPGGLDAPSPRSHAGLFRQVLHRGGVLISEYPPGTSVRKYHFRRRNGLIAALSFGVWVLRAGKKSGTMLTVDAARHLDRPLAAMPGSPDEALARGCLEMIRQGATLIADGEHLKAWWQEICPPDWEANTSHPAAGAPKDSEEEKVDEEDSSGCPVLRAARRLDGGGEGFSLEALVRQVDEPAAELQSLLLRHELSGLIERQAGGDRYRFRRSY